MTEPFAHLFPEWALTWSLRKSCNKDASRLWREIQFYPAGGQSKTTLAEAFPTPTVPRLLHERAFLKKDQQRYGIDVGRYESTFWSLRPDFTFESADQSLLLLLEAKAGVISSSAWKHPKVAYRQFLEECANPQRKGFFYIIPQEYAENFRKCLTEHFAGPVQTGLFLWEDLLPVIYEKLMETAIDQVAKEMDGLRKIRAWREHVDNCERE
jgi:hypothetical protein